MKKFIDTTSRNKRRDSSQNLRFSNKEKKSLSHFTRSKFKRKINFQRRDDVDYDTLEENVKVSMRSGKLKTLIEFFFFNGFSSLNVILDSFTLLKKTLSITFVIPCLLAFFIRQLKG